MYIFVCTKNFEIVIRRPDDDGKQKFTHYTHSKQFKDRRPITWWNKMEAKKNSCLSRLPRLRVGLVMLVAASSTLTLIVINLTDQWVSQSFTQLERKPGRNRNHFGAAFDMMRSHDKKDKLGGLAWPSRDPRLSSRKRVHDKDLLLGNLTRRFSTERADTDAPDMATAWHQTLKTNDQTAVEQTGAVIQGATRGGPTILPRVDNTGFTLQATKRSEMKKNAHKLRSNRAVLRRNLYDWNDRDPLAYKTLPLRNGTESNQWERTEAIIFNRVPKCGSRSVVDLLRKLSAKNDFNLISSLVHNMSVKSQAWPKRLARTLDIVKTPYLFQRHFHYFNFSQFNAREPLYINIIRDPLARMVSAYYFKRFGDSHLKPHFKGTEEEKYRSVTDCILKSHYECSAKKTQNIIPFFCGPAMKCRSPSQWSLDQAKENVRKHFIFVGVLEDLENSFRVLEKLLPRYFNGAWKLFTEPDKEQVIRDSSIKTKTKTKNKEKPSPEAEAVMKGRMHYEYEFYFFIKERLEKLKTKFDIEDVR